MARTDTYNDHMNIISSDEDQLFIPRSSSNEFAKNHPNFHVIDGYTTDDISNDGRKTTRKNREKRKYSSKLNCFSCRSRSSGHRNTKYPRRRSRDKSSRYLNHYILRSDNTGSRWNKPISREHCGADYKANDNQDPRCNRSYNGVYNSRLSMNQNQINDYNDERKEDQSKIQPDHVISNTDYDKNANIRCDSKGNIKTYTNLQNGATNEDIYSTRGGGDCYNSKYRPSITSCTNGRSLEHIEHANVYSERQQRTQDGAGEGSKVVNRIDLEEISGSHANLNNNNAMRETNISYDSINLIQEPRTNEPPCFEGCQCMLSHVPLTNSLNHEYSNTHETKHGTDTCSTIINNNTNNNNTNNNNNDETDLDSNCNFQDWGAISYSRNYLAIPDDTQLVNVAWKRGTCASQRRDSNSSVDLPVYHNISSESTESNSEEAHQQSSHESKGDLIRKSDDNNQQTSRLSTLHRDKCKLDDKGNVFNTNSEEICADVYNKQNSNRSNIIAHVTTTDQEYEGFQSDEEDLRNIRLRSKPSRVSRKRSTCRRKNSFRPNDVVSSTAASTKKNKTHHKMRRRSSTSALTSNVKVNSPRKTTPTKKSHCKLRSRASTSILDALNRSRGQVDHVVSIDDIDRMYKAQISVHDNAENTQNTNRLCNVM